ncbi:cell division control protein 6 homolog [Pundamilia nyererei]|uniref:Cell division control protein 6 homolog n=1 Tax=Pundamilia nyererei TaxID=303518 RepID=A0A9Y6MB70_9CICH|nr:PREDICTED: cell division control protein 6 homolog [Pundamilia nyererei]
MPSTRSQGRAQPTLQFPRRKSSRVSSRSKKPEPQKSPAVSPIKPEPQAPGLTRIGPLSPRRPINLSTPLSPRRYTDRPTPLSPMRPVALLSPLSPRRTSAQPPAPSSPRLQSRIPLSPRKRTGDDNVCNLGTSLQCSPTKQRKLSLASPRKLGFDENSPVQARRQLIPSSGQQTPPSTAKSSPKREETPTGSPIHKNLNKKPPVARLFGEILIGMFRKLLVLDEMDQLDSKAQDVLYTIFEWPYLPKSRLCLIGIANALDLTDRILPRLQARPQCRPLLLHFPPYSREELTAIVQDRLVQASAEGLLDASAVQFCARKVSAVSGDARKALDICRRAVEIVESDERKKASDPKGESKASRVSLPQVARVLSEVYGDRMASQSSGSEGESFPLQQKLLVCCLLLLIRNGKSKEIGLGKLHEVYSRLCAQRQVSGVGQGECLSLCSLLESRGIVALKKAKEARLTKVFLKIEEKDVENALKDRTLLGSILAAGLPS